MKGQKTARLRVHLVRTFYPHWGAHTAFNCLKRHLEAAGLVVRDSRVAMDSGRFPLSLLERPVARRSRQRGMREYRLRDLGADLCSLAACLRARVDVIHLLDGEHSLMNLPRWLRRLPRSRRPALVATLHQPAELLPRLLRPEHLEAVDCILTVSPDQEEFLAGWIPRAGVRTVLLGVDTEFFSPMDPPPPERPFVCLSGGIWMRDYEALLETANHLRDLGNLEFHVVSPPEDFNPKDDRITIHRSVSDRNLLQLYRTSHLLFLPLKNATANTFLLEGAACGLPVLSTERLSTRAYFPGNGAVLVPGNDPAAFADTIRFLYDNPGKRHAMSLAARRRAKELGWDRVAEEYVTLYGKVARNQRKNRRVK